jgi:hypothetical protein
MRGIYRIGLGAAVAVCSFSISTAELSAQMLGISSGVTVANLDGSGVSGLDSRTSFNAGVFATFPVNDRFSVTPGFYYVEKGAVHPEDDLALKLNYLEIPLLVGARLYGGDRYDLSAFAGPTFAFEVQCFQEVTFVSEGVEDTGHVECSDLDEAVETRSLDVGAMVGVGVLLGVSERTSLLVHGGVDLGLTDINEFDGGGDVKNSAFFVNAGLVWSPGG